MPSGRSRNAPAFRVREDRDCTSPSRIAKVNLTCQVVYTSYHHPLQPAVLQSHTPTSWTSGPRGKARDATTRRFLPANQIWSDGRTLLIRASPFSQF
jgi:hypothetical protein